MQRQPVVDGGRSNCGVAHRDADLRQPLDHVPGSIEPRHDRQLVRIDEQSTLAIMRCAEHGRRTGAGAQAKCHIKTVGPPPITRQSMEQPRIRPRSRLQDRTEVARKGSPDICRESPERLAWLTLTCERSCRSSRPRPRCGEPCPSPFPCAPRPACRAKPHRRRGLPC